MKRDSQSDGGVSEILKRAEQTMMVAIYQAIKATTIAAKRELQSVGIRNVPAKDDYFQHVALHLMFLRQCGADTDTSMGGDRKRASRLLHIGNRIARSWRGDDAGNEGTVLTMSEEDQQDRRDLAEVAGKLALRSAIRVLVEHASQSDPGLRDRMTAMMETSIATLDMQPDTAEFFAEYARGSLRALTRPLDTE